MEKRQNLEILTKNFNLDKSQVGFTLAEVLITLGIIGVVAAMTIPNLINNYKAAKLKSQFLKTYSILQQVFKQMDDDGISTDVKDYSYNGANYYKNFTSYLTGATFCKNRPPLCYDANANNIIYKGISWAHLDDGQILLPDGTLLMFENARNGRYIFITADLNGIKNPPNIVGYDTFTFELTNGELRPMGDIGTTYVGEQYCDINKILQLTQNSPKATGAPYGLSCTHYAKVDTEYFKKIVKKYKY